MEDVGITDGDTGFFSKIELLRLHKTSKPKFDDPEDKTAFALKVADLLMWKKFNQWIEEYGPLAFFGYNSINFDEEFLRRTFYKNLFPPFLTSSTNYGVSNMSKFWM